MIESSDIPDTPAGPELLRAFKLLHRSINYLTDPELRVLFTVFDHTLFLDRETAPLTVTDIEQHTRLSRPTVSQTAQTLVVNGILSRHRVHTKMPFVYRINLDRLEILANRMQ